MSSASMSHSWWKIKRWDFSLESKKCPLCKGKATIEMERDLHRSAGTIPCDFGYFQGHGYPTCVKGKLIFSDYDKINKIKLMEEFPV